MSLQKLSFLLLYATKCKVLRLYLYYVQFVCMCYKYRIDLPYLEY